MTPSVFATTFIGGLIIATTTMTTLLPYPKAAAIFAGGSPSLSATEKIGVAAAATAAALVAWIVSNFLLLFLYCGGKVLSDVVEHLAEASVVD